VNPHTADYVAGLIAEDLGLPEGALAASMVPTDLAELVVDSVRGSESSASPDPIVEQRISGLSGELERSILDRDGFLLRKARWPGAAPYAACLTHDVDNISRPMGHIISVRDRFSSSDFLLARLGLRSLYNNLSYLSSIEDKRGLRSSLYLLSSNYDLSRISGALRRLQAKGWDIGLHGDFGTHDSAEKMAASVAKFRSGTGLDPRGLREHYLQFDYSVSWGIMDGQGFDYDSTVGNRDHLGFRIGLCTPFHPPGEDWKPMRILEIPLVLMDTTLWGYLKRSEEEGFQDFLGLKDKVARVEGLFTILWHQEALRMRGGRIYPSLLDALLGDGCFIGSGGAIASWWTARSRPLMGLGNEFRMESCPEGLCLRFKAKEERTLSVDGGKVELHGTDAMVRVDAGSFRLRVK
jgi:hypothetical protein